MKKQVLFIQGGGNDGYEADTQLVASLQSLLGKDYKIHYPCLTINEDAPDFGWPHQIGKELEKRDGKIILVAHSLGASMLLKYLSENNVSGVLAGIFLIATPFWEGAEKWVQALRLREDFANRLPQNVPIFFYHCADDQEVPLSHFLRYQERLPRASFCKIAKGGHQLGHEISRIAKDVKRTVG